MGFFKLLIDGEDIDTGNYRYFPFADAVIKDYKGVLKATNALNKGRLVDGFEKIIYNRR